MITRKPVRKAVAKRPTAKKVAYKPSVRSIPRRMHGANTAVYSVAPYKNNILKAIEYTKKALSDNYLANLIKKLDADVANCQTNDQILKTCTKYLGEIKAKSAHDERVEAAYRRALADGYETKYDLVGQDGNAFSLMGYVARALRREGMSDYVEEMQKEATKSDYDGLLRVCIKYIDYANMKHFENNDYDKYPEKAHPFRGGMNREAHKKFYIT